MKHFDIDKTAWDASCIIKIMGELDASSSVAADQAIEDAICQSPEIIIIDCSELIYVSSAGLGVFLAAYQACQQKNIAFIFVGVQAKIRNIFSILGLDKVLTISDTVQDALALVQSE